MIEENGSLRHPYLSINYKKRSSYGSSQSWSADKVMKVCGCGVTSPSDILSYIGLHKAGCQTELIRNLRFSAGSIEYEEYNKYLERMRKLYFPVIPYLGMPGWMVAIGFNRYFRRYHISFSARWAVLPGNMMACMRRMIESDIPVTLAIGPNFPLIWRKKKLQLYVKSSYGEYMPAERVCAHYVTVTGIQDGVLRVSSWGREYYIVWKEYQVYVRKFSNFLLCNICVIK